MQCGTLDIDPGQHLRRLMPDRSFPKLGSSVDDKFNIQFHTDHSFPADSRKPTFVEHPNSSNDCTADGPRETLRQTGHLE
jgi:hypothetical protein